MLSDRTTPTLFDTPPPPRRDPLRPSVLLVAAGKLYADEERRNLAGQGLNVEVSRSVAEAMERLTAKAYDALVLQWRTLEVEFLGREWRAGWQRCVQLARRANRDLVLVVNIDANTRIPEEAARLADWVDRGAVDAARLGRAIPQTAPPVRAADWLAGISSAAQDLVKLVEAVARRQAPVLITGESGTGKSHVAEVIHRLQGTDAGEPRTVWCHGGETGGFPWDVGGDTGGPKPVRLGSKPGRSPAGAVILEGVEDLSLDQQTKFLHLLVRDAGGEPRWIVSAAPDLHRRAVEGRFLEALLYRLAVYPIALPPLRERLEDVPALLDHFLARICRRDHLLAPKVAPDVAPALMQRQWPGNLRELANAVEFAVVRAGGRGELWLEDFPPVPPERDTPAADGSARLPRGQDLHTAVARFERTLIERALAETGGNRQRAAVLLGVKRTTLVEKLRRLDRAP